MRHYTETDIRAALGWDDLISSQAQALAALASGSAVLAPRALVDYAGGTAFAYLARASEHGWPVVKFGSVNPDNPGRGLPSVHAYVYALDRATGELAASADGEAVTSLRTPAATIAALEALGEGAHAIRPVVIVGTGRQAHMHAEAIAHRYPERRINLVPGRDRAAIRASLAEPATVVLCTSSFEPVLEASWLQPGSCVASIGAFSPQRLEFGADLVQRAGRVFADDAETCLRQCGPVVSAVADGLLDADDVVSIGDVISGTFRPTATDGDIALYCSVGLGVQDAAVMQVLLDRDGTEARDR